MEGGMPRRSPRAVCMGRSWRLYVAALVAFTAVGLILLVACSSPGRNGQAQDRAYKQSMMLDPVAQSVLFSARKALPGMAAASIHPHSELGKLQALSAEKPGQQRHFDERLSSKGCSKGICPSGSAPKPEEFVVAIATHEHNEPTLVAGRSGRMGMHTYISTNYTPSEERAYPSSVNETWDYYPDDHPLRSFYEGDTRAALIPFLAYRSLGDTFKWLFYGDDDTAFFVHAAAEMVKHLDPEMPYFLTDHFWFDNWNYGYSWHPHWRAPRCLPCNWEGNSTALKMKMARGCPCTPQLMCNLEGGYDGVLSPSKCSAPRAPTIAYSMHGGAGALISIGMLKAVSFERMEDCALREWNTGGDAFITTCLWDEGYGMTDPGPLWHPSKHPRFDPGPMHLIIDQTPYVIPRVAYTLGNFIATAAGTCTELCQLELENTVSLHFRARLLTNSSAGASVLLRSLSRFYSKHTASLQGVSADYNVSVEDTQDAKAARLALQVDAKIEDAIKQLRDLDPFFQEVVKKTKVMEDKAAARGKNLTLETESYEKSKGKRIVMSLDNLRKSGASDIAQKLLEDVLEIALQAYPPEPVY